MSNVLFPMGRLVATPGALKTMEEHHIDGLKLLSRHQAGDWGDLSASDKAENNLSVKEGFRILSSYVFGEVKVWVITEADRSSTCILLPSEY